MKSCIIAINPTRQKIIKKNFFGFDIETCNKNKDFLCASIYSDIHKKTFYDKRSLIDEFKNKIYRNSYVCATNLGFDFFGAFFNEPEMKKFFLQFRGSDLIYAKTYISGHDFTRDYNGHSLTFLDTMNYGRLSVEKMGKILKDMKLKRPENLGHRPKNKKEWETLIRYNMKDAEISYKFMLFLKRSFEELGATFKKTIASSAMSLFKNRYLKQSFIRNETYDLLEQFRGYYGGRCECFERGLIEGDYFYYDFNSLYPSVMLNDFPNPNTIRKNNINDISYILSYDGLTDVTVSCPDDILPLLPYRNEKKLMFPTGIFRGFYTNIELRKAMQLGYCIKHIHKNIYFRENCRPFDDFVRELYKKRKELKMRNNPMEYVVKIIMNSLYGKFGEKFIDRDNIIPCPETLEELNKYDFIEPIGDFIRVKKYMSIPKAHCIPSWAAYVTAYGRIKLYELLSISAPVYCDTDSVITKRKLYNSDELGGLKCEHHIKKMIIVRPKFYMLDDSESPIFKVKGAGKKLMLNDFNGILASGKISYTKFMRFKESIRRGFIPNELQGITKIFSLEDDKRKWEKPFDITGHQYSKPVNIKNIPKIIYIPQLNAAFE